MTAREHTQRSLLEYPIKTKTDVLLVQEEVDKSCETHNTTI